MFDPVTLDQLRALVAVVETGSFSAAARKLRRVQSAVSTSMSNLEERLGVPLWDRSGKVVKLTYQGQSVLAQARRVLAEMDALRKLANDMEGGLEAQVSLCVDALFPLKALVDVCSRFAKEFERVDLRVDTEVMSAVSARVLSGAASIGVVSPMGIAPGLERQALAPIRMLAVVAPRHPLATAPSPIPSAVLANAVQIVLSERGDVGVADQAVLSARTWRVGDLYTKHALLRAGLGWGNLPEHLVRDDLAHKRLVAVRPAAWGEQEHQLYLSAIHRADTTFGPAHRWLLNELGTACRREAPRVSSRARARRTA